MSSRQGFLVNNPNPSKVVGTGLDVAEGAVRLTCIGLGLPGAAWQVRVGDAKTGTWVNVVRFGVPIILSDNNTQYIEVVAGTYRVAPVSLPGTSQVWFQEDEVTTSDARTTYIFGQENTNQNGITGNSTPSIEMSGNGTVAAPLRLDVEYSTDANNLAHAGTDGAVSAVLNTQDTTSIHFTGTGTVASKLQSIVKVSATAGNQVTINPDGIFVPAPSAGANLNPVDALAIATSFFSSCVGLGLTIGTPINISVTTTPDTIYARATFTGNALTVTNGALETPATMPALGSIGATITSLVTGGAADGATSAALPTFANLNGNGFIQVTGTIAETVSIFIQVALTLQ